MILIKIGVIIIAIIALALVLALFTKNKYSITREIIIHKPKQEVFDFIKLNSNQKLYNKWLLLDPYAKIELKGQDGMPGSILAFDSKSKKTGKGEWEIKKISNGESLDFELRFLAPFVFTANGHLTTETLSPDSTRLKWVYNSGMNWPANLVLLFMDMEKVIGPDLTETMLNIKTVLEK